MAWKKKWDLLSIRIIGISTIAFVGVFAALTVDDHTDAPAVNSTCGRGPELIAEVPPNSV